MLQLEKQPHQRDLLRLENKATQLVKRNAFRNRTVVHSVVFMAHFGSLSDPKNAFSGCFSLEFPSCAALIGCNVS
jgi:hypothetical protein